ncbi:MAG TPA: MFS transporter [Vitreimonas sp.]|nr:MFS transporter [Vitreimonas sp.]
MVTAHAQRVFQRNTKLLYIVEFFFSAIFLIPVWVMYMLQYLSLSEFALIETIIFALQLIMELPTGAFADLVGKKWSMAAGSFFKGVAMIAFLMARDFEAFAVYAILMGIGEALISGAHEALLYDTLKEARQERHFDQWQSKYTLVFQLGVATTTLAGGLLGGINLVFPIALTMLMHFCSALAICFLIEPLPDTEKFTLKRYLLQTKLGTQELFKSRYNLKISLFYILVGGISWACQLTFNNLFMVTLKYTATELGIAFATMRVFNSLVLFRLLNFSKAFTKPRTFIFFPLLLMISLTPALWLSKWIALPFVAGSMLASTARWAILGKYTNQVFDSKKRATAISALSMGINIFYVGLLLLSGPIMQWWGGPAIVLSVLGITATVLLLPLGLHIARSYSNEEASSSET